MMKAYESYSDIELLSYLKAGDHLAFNEIYDRHWEKLYQQAFRLLRDEATTLDVLQEIFTWLWANREQVRLKSFAGYLAMAVRYKMANYIRHGKVKLDAFKKIADESLKELNTTVDSYEVKELQTIIEQFTAQLPTRCREIFHLSRSAWLTNPEIAERLQLSEKTVENQLTIALKKLRLHLAKHSHLFFLFL